jgi:hypothetical protein
MRANRKPAGQSGLENTTTSTYDYTSGIGQCAMCGTNFSAYGFMRQCCIACWSRKAAMCCSDGQARSTREPTGPPGALTLTRDTKESLSESAKECLLRAREEVRS